MSTFAREERQRMNFAADRREVIELRDIEIDERDFTGVPLANVCNFPLVPLTSEQDAYELVTTLATLQFTLDEFFEQICTGVDWARDYPLLEKTRLRLVAQLSMNSKGMTDTYRYIDGVDELCYRIDIVVFETLLECVACMQEEDEMRTALDTMVPRTAFPELCADNIIPRGLVGIAPAKFNVADIVSAMKALEFRWCFIEYRDELTFYLDCLLARLAYLYKNPQDAACYSSINDYMQVFVDGLYVPSQRMLEDFCWAFRPMYQKLCIRPRLGGTVVSGKLSADSRAKLQALVSKNARDFNNKTLTDAFQKMYPRYIIRPSELERYYRAKSGKYAEAIRVMKFNRSKDAVNSILERMSAAPWTIVDPAKPLFDEASTDLMYLLLIDSMANNLWNLEFMTTFVIMNLDLVAEPDLPARLNVLHPLIVQDFNHFNLLYDGKLHIHNSMANSFVHWIQCMQRPPHNGYYNGLRIDPTKFNSVADFDE